MDRLISEKAVLDLLNTAKEQGIKQITIQYLEDIIKQLPTVKPKTDWVPVSEGLPKKNMACLVAVGKYNLTQMAMYSDLMGTIDHRIFYQGDYADDNFENITQYVKAWMPLPESYKAESEG